MLQPKIYRKRCIMCGKIFRSIMRSKKSCGDPKEEGTCAHKRNRLMSKINAERKRRMKNTTLYVGHLNF